MTIISASQVKELRERTGAGMMDCKKALAENNGDLERAIESLRKLGQAKVDKKANRIAAEGAIVIAETDNQAVMVEINSETDFVARDANFTAFARAVGETILLSQPQDNEALNALPLSGYTPNTVEAMRQELVTKVGENVQIRRFVKSTNASIIGSYNHGNRIGVIVELEGGDKALARDIAMHIAASKPLVISPNDVSKELVEKEKEIYMAQAATSGKPQEIIEKMVAGRLKKYLDEVSLEGQPFVKDPDITVGGLLNKNRARVVGFNRFEVGEGIEKISEDFAEAVKSQMQGS